MKPPSAVADRSLDREDDLVHLGVPDGADECEVPDGDAHEGLGQCLMDPTNEEPRVMTSSTTVMPEASGPGDRSGRVTTIVRR